MPFKKGESGNPAGRRKGTIFPTSDSEIKRFWTESGKAAALIEDPKDRAAAYARLTAIGAEYMYEKPKTIQELQGKGGAPLVAVLHLGGKPNE